ncbi:uncharacterized protein EV420DRAFT_1648387 [Desarmillaria tabescens]|uniref:Uncharacterized protein n=1 Tax=Armillaria tabescens TaxID=1929756 RepID=A0AA39JN39_ARMTA|nr:uncharacterized protein EV420DRAFT_1648387 [Desarmillaria tabescens]KAK0445673.1 hypothetical protein EV420DRAFT_1648387 [Desarmillaria tabescens]
MPAILASSCSKTSSSSKVSKPSSKVSKPPSNVIKPPSNTVKPSSKVVPLGKTSQKKSAQINGPVQHAPTSQAKLSVTVPIEDLEDHVDDASGNEGQNFEEGEESTNELGFGSLEDDILDEGKSEAEGESDGEREDEEEEIPPWILKENWVLNMCHMIGKVIPHVVSLFTPVDVIILSLNVKIKDLPYKSIKESRGTNMNKIHYDILTLCLKDPVNGVITPPKSVHKCQLGSRCSHLDFFYFAA